MWCSIARSACGGKEIGHFRCNCHGKTLVPPGGTNSSVKALLHFKKYRFSDQWALRIFKRHNLRSRVVIIKIRKEVPRGASKVRGEVGSF